MNILSWRDLFWLLSHTKCYTYEQCNFPLSISYMPVLAGGLVAYSLLPLLEPLHLQWLTFLRLFIVEEVVLQ